jgi:threonine dehydratase
VPTLADGLAGQIDDDALEIGQHGIDDIVTLTETEIGRTIAWPLVRAQQRVEGAGACATGAVWLRKLASIQTPAAIVVSGGNIDAAKFDALILSS